MKAFRAKHGQDVITRLCSSGSSAPIEASTPSKATGARGGGSASAKRKKNAFTPINTPSKGGKSAGDGDDGFEDDEMDVDTPSKKPKIKKGDRYVILSCSDNSGLFHGLRSIQSICANFLTSNSPLLHSNHDPISFDEFVKEENEA